MYNNKFMQDKDINVDTLCNVIDKYMLTLSNQYLQQLCL